LGAFLAPLHESHDTCVLIIVNRRFTYGSPLCASIAALRIVRRSGHQGT
jgi:hypothetical protein